MVGAIPSQEIPRELRKLLRGGTVGGGYPFARDPRRSLVELRDLVHSAILLVLNLRFPANILLNMLIAPMLD